MGVVQFGSEAFHSVSDVTFEVTGFAVGVQRNLQQTLPQVDPDDPDPGEGGSMGRRESKCWWVLVWVVGTAIVVALG